ncbi:UDP-3-O-[3-hydroxymyristoyl] glucosamine N-acyltransferase [Haloferula luteola]|uniref:UDP-3-O-acylglucosamine N-acyltransferase n=1 Tax=Haloferula luteola TaxID=595692 RepID=A0A840UZR7_9BACT|nr:UDP-3-O-(3-hydroxymyristoyl)glucosamine N-acyltransferase [Haloferula luteola]MBB5351607.1 UDP-3-O-[3-hydroxymyristoyl] glucosamine N-acyltransferase [Haloferula luteola]
MEPRLRQPRLAKASELPCVSQLILSELARQVDGDVVRGELSLSITGIAALDEAGPGDVSFLGNEKYRQQFLETQASVVLVPRGVTEGPDHLALIACDNPSFAFGWVVKHFTESLARVFVPGIHERAVVDPTVQFDPERVRIHAGAVVQAGAKIGDGTEIGPNAVVGENVVVGRDCLIHANVSIRERCLVGDRVILQPGAVIGSDGFGYETVAGRHVKIDQIGIVEIQDDVEIGANTTIDRARFGRTVIGTGSKIDNLVQVGHNVQIGPHNFFVSQSGIAGSSRTGAYVIAAAQAGIAGHVRVGDQAILAARTGVTANLEGHKTYGGYPAQLQMDEQRQKALLRQLPKLFKRLRKWDGSSNP